MRNLGEIYILVFIYFNLIYFFRLKDEESFNKVYEEVERKYCRGGEKKLKTEYEVLCKIKKCLIEDKKHIR